MITDLIDGILDSGFLNGLINLIFQIVIGLTKVIIYPFGILVKTFLPDLDNALINISTYLDYVGSGIGWAKSAFAIPNTVIALIIAYAVFSFYLPFQLWALKLALSWKKALWG